MSTSKIHTSVPAATDSQWSTEPPTQPGCYWFRCDPPSRDIMVQVRETNGELTVWWPDKDQPVAKLRAIGAVRSRHQLDREADSHSPLASSFATLLEYASL